MKPQKDKRSLLGFVLVLVGTALLLRYLDLIPWNLPHYVFSWKSLLILLGIVLITSEKNKTTGTILLVIGSVFLLADIFDQEFWEVVRFVVPLVLIIAGVAILIRRQSYSKDEINQTGEKNSADVINDVSVFGGGEKKILSKNFKGGQLTAIFGGSEIDFRKAELAEGVNAIDLLCIFGGVSMRVPEGWHVKTEVNAIFGGFSDERSFMDHPEENTEPKKVLYIKGLVLFGGGELK
jgi:predicted membrane protein